MSRQQRFGKKNLRRLYISWAMPIGHGMPEAFRRVDSSTRFLESSAREIVFKGAFSWVSSLEDGGGAK